MELQLSMVVLEVADIEASLRFYRRLGLEMPDPVGGGTVVAHRMGSGVTLLLTTAFASRYDPTWTPPSGGGYSQMLEFYVGDDDVVDSTWTDLVEAGYTGRMPPTRTIGPYAALVEDPDGNVVLLTSDEAASPDAT
ncbi:VOC family protein [Microbacterium sp. HD4P20]|uniref:VOC family protein n=1 Tax=Microbacterium sp. HD4P20 TaxID=2864874 RepID=UPI001C63CCC3|nr:VOC family protein [Microbacterium sp. HD4P20]MCP2638011.1 VOC family protein [Microbacterium sp. HD4P20]